MYRLAGYGEGMGHEPGPMTSATAEPSVAAPVAVGLLAEDTLRAAVDTLVQLVEAGGALVNSLPARPSGPHSTSSRKGDRRGASDRRRAPTWHRPAATRRPAFAPGHRHGHAVTGLEAAQPTIAETVAPLLVPAAVVIGLRCLARTRSMDTARGVLLDLLLVAGPLRLPPNGSRAGTRAMRRDERHEGTQGWRIARCAL
jgi:hypothetical protein